MRETGPRSTETRLRKILHEISSAWEDVRHLRRAENEAYSDLDMAVGGFSDFLDDEAKSKEVR